MLQGPHHHSMHFYIVGLIQTELQMEGPDETMLYNIERRPYIRQIFFVEATAHTTY